MYSWYQYIKVIILTYDVNISKLDMDKRYQIILKLFHCIIVV